MKRKIEKLKCLLNWWLRELMAIFLPLFFTIVHLSPCFYPRIQTNDERKGCERPSSRGKNYICFFLHSTIWNQPIMQKEIGHGTRKTIYVKCIQGKKNEDSLLIFFFLVNWFDFETVLYEGDVCFSSTYYFFRCGKGSYKKEKQALGLGPSVNLMGAQMLIHCSGNQNNLRISLSVCLCRLLCRVRFNRHLRKNQIGITDGPLHKSTRHCRLLWLFCREAGTR